MSLTHQRSTANTMVLIITAHKRLIPDIFALRVMALYFR
jgi:hypothetical protein